MSDTQKTPETKNEDLKGSDLVLADNSHLDPDDEVLNLHEEESDHEGV